VRIHKELFFVFGGRRNGECSDWEQKFRQHVHTKRSWSYVKGNALDAKAIVLGCVE